MAKWNEFLRRTSAWLLAIMLTFTPMVPASLAEGDAIDPAPAAEATAEPATEPTAAPTAEPTAKPTAEPTAEPTAAPSVDPSGEPTPGDSPAPSVEPSADPSVDPSANPSTEPSVDPSVEPSLEPSPSVEPDALLAGILEPQLDTYTDPLKPEVTEAPLLSGDVYAWKVIPQEGYNGTITYTRANKDKTDDDVYLEINQSGVITTYAGITKIVDVIVTATPLSGNPVSCTVTIYPKPSFFGFKLEYRSPVNISTSTAEGYTFKTAKNATVDRYEFKFNAGFVPDTTEMAMYESLIAFSSSSSAVPINAQTGVLTNLASQYSSTPVTANITIKLLSLGSQQLSSTVLLTVCADPDKVEIDKKTVTVPLGGAQEIEYTLKDSNGGKVTLDSDAVTFTSADESIVSFDGSKAIGCGVGHTTITVALAKNPSKYATATVNVQDVPEDDDILLVDENNNSISDSTGLVSLGLGESLDVYIKLTDEASLKYIGLVSASASASYFTVTKPAAVSGQTGVYKCTLKGITNTSALDPGDLPVLTVTLNSDLNLDGQDHSATVTRTIEVLDQPHTIELNYDEINLCVNDTFTLIAVPMPTGTSSRYTCSASNTSVVSVLPIATPAGGEPSYGYFIVNARAVGTSNVVITASAGSKPTATCKVTVSKAPTSIFLVGPITLGVGTEYQLTPKYLSADGTESDGTFTYEIIKGDSFASITPEGLVTATSAGQAKVEISSPLYKINSITVTLDIIAPGDVKIKFGEGAYQLALGESITIRPIYDPETARARLVYTLTKASVSTGEAVTMKVAKDEQSVTLTASTKITGKYTLTVETSYPNDPSATTSKATCTIYIGNAPTKISVKSGYSTMGVDQTIRPEYVLTPTDAVVSDVYYSLEPIADSELQYFDENGLIAYRTRGTAVTDDQIDTNDYTKSVSGEFKGTYIRALTAGWIRVQMRPRYNAHSTGVRCTWLIEILAKPETIEFEDTTEVQLLPGMTFTRKASFTPASAYGNITYESSNDAIATVDSKGVVTAHNYTESGPYTVTIYASTYNLAKYASYKVTVYKGPESIVFSDLEQDTEDATRFMAEIGVGETRTLVPSFPNCNNVDPDPVTYTNSATGYLKGTLLKKGTTDANGVTRRWNEYQVTGAKVGESQIISATAPNGTSASVYFNVLAKPYKIAFQQSKATVGVGEEYPLNVQVYKTSSVLADETVRQQLVYTCSNTAIAQVSKDGVVKVSNSTAYIGKSFTVTATSACGTTTTLKKISCVLTVCAEPTNIRVNELYPIERENINALHLVAGSNTIAQVAIGFSPDSASSYIDFFDGIDEDDYVTSLDEEEVDDKPGAFVCLYSKLAADGRNILYIQSIDKTRTGSMTLTPKAYSGHTASFTIYVNANIATEAEVTLPDAEITLPVGATYQVSPVITNSAKSASFEFYTASSTYLTIGKLTGLLTARKASNQKQDVTVKWNDGATVYKKTMKVNIVGAPSTILFKRLSPMDETEVVEEGLTAITVNLTVGETRKLRYYFSPTTAISDNMTIELANAALGEYASGTLKKDPDLKGGVITLSADKVYNYPIVFTVTSTVGTSVKTAKITVNVKPMPNYVFITTPSSRSIKMLPGSSYKIKASTMPENAGGTIYYSYGATKPDVLKSLNPYTGEIVIEDEVTNVDEADRTFKIYAFSTAFGDDATNDITSLNTCEITVYRSLLASDIEDNLYYKGTDTLYTELANKDMCVGESISLGCKFPIGSEFLSTSGVVFRVKPGDEAYISATTAGVITAKLDTVDEYDSSAPVRQVTVYAMPATVASDAYGKGLALNFTIYPKPTKLTVSANNTDYSSIFSSGLKLTSGDVFDLEDSSLADVEFTVLPAISAPFATITAKSSNTKVVTIAQDEDNSDHWTLTAVDKGTAYIYFYVANGKVKSANAIKVIVYNLPTAIKVSAEEIELGEGMSKTVTASYLPTSSYTDKPIYVAPSDAAKVKATVDVDDDMKFVVVGVAPTEDAYVRVGSQDSRVYATTNIPVTVLPGPDKIEFPDTDNVTSSALINSLGVGETVRLQFEVTEPEKMKTEYTFTEDRAPDGGNISWSLKNSTKVGNVRTYRIDVKGVKKGDTALRVTASNGETAVCTITVKDALSKVTLGVPSSTIKLAIGEQYDFEYYGPTPDADVRYEGFTVSKSNNDVISLVHDSSSHKVTVTALAKGSNTVTVYGYNRKSAKVKFVVSNTSIASNATIKLSKNMTINEGAIGKLSYSLSRAVGGNVVFEYVDPDDDAYDVLGLNNPISSGGYEGSKTGIVCPVAMQTEKAWTSQVRAVFTDDATGETRESNIVTITVRPGPAESPLTNSIDGDIEIGVGESVSFKYVQPHKYSYYTKFSYESSDIKVATVSSSGSIKGVAVGNADITMTAQNGLKVTIGVTVKKAPTKVLLKSGLFDSDGYLHMTVGEKLNLSGNTQFSTVDSSVYASYKMTYKSSSSKYAKIVANTSGGYDLEAVKAGKITLTLTTFNRKSQKYTVYVEN